jgi:branched-chain amino acid transport system ATP-binding protein
VTDLAVPAEAEVPALQLVDVVAGYGEITILHGVSLRVPRASVTALLGPNGAGKTTLLNVASGNVGPRQGQVLIGSDDVTRMRPHERARAGLRHIPERRGIFPSLTVKDNLRLQGKRGQEDEAIERAVAAFPILGSRLRQVAGTLSGGQQQMVAIARAYDPDASVILVDEASIGLAPVIVDEIFSFLQQVSAGLLLVEQYVSRALEMAQNVYVLSSGRIVYAGAAAELDDKQVFDFYLDLPSPPKGGLAEL